MDSHETMDHLKMKALQKMAVNIKRVPLDFFALFEIINMQSDLQERMIPGNENVWQLLSRWEEERQVHQKLKNKESQPVYILMLKIIYPFDYIESDFLSLQLTFSQTFYDLFTGKFSPQSNDIEKMVYLLNNAKGLTLNVTQCLPYLPKNKFNQQFVDYRDKINTKQITPESINLEDAQKRFLQLARSYNQMSCIYFRIRYCLNKKFINDAPVFIGLKPFRIIFVKEGESEVLDFYEFKDIVKWGTQKPNNIIFYTSDQKQHLCETNQIDQIEKYIISCQEIQNKIKNIILKKENLSNYTSSDLNINPKLISQNYLSKVNQIEKNQQYYRWVFIFIRNKQEMLETIMENDQFEQKPMRQLSKK